MVCVRLGFFVSEAKPLVVSLFCWLTFPKVFFGVLSPSSTALRIPCGFSDRRFKTAPDLSSSNQERAVLAKHQ
ncbi:hypothetical protein CGJ61_23095 [Vibrio parahaemolyticus]|nr:hypothetical protein CGJ61_23095 [Vibrio parahaemolyticus]